MEEGGVSGLVHEFKRAVTCLREVWVSAQNGHMGCRQSRIASVAEQRKQVQLEKMRG